MARVSRPIGQFLRRAVLKWARQQVLPRIRDRTSESLDDADRGAIDRWGNAVFSFRMEDVRAGVEALQSLGTPLAAPKVSTLAK